MQPIKLKKLIPSYGKEYLIGWTHTGDILELNTSQNCFIKRKNVLSNVFDFQFIYPVCNYFVTLSMDKLTLSLYEVSTGKEVILKTTYYVYFFKKITK